MNEPERKLVDILAIDRTRLAAERSLMAWVRTALSMITFGFTFYKFMQFLNEQSETPLARPRAPRNLAIALIGIGTTALIIACVQHWRYVHTLSNGKTHSTWDLAFIVACLLALLGLLLFGSVIVGSGPFG
jgi:putative membrane protein